MEQALRVVNLKKNYGKFEALHGISFEVASGEIFALIGPNGAGKTTTLRIVATILQPTSGTVHVYGMDVQKMHPGFARSSATFRRRLVPTRT